MMSLKKIFFPTTISIMFSIFYYVGLYINSEIYYLKTLVYKTTEKMRLINDKYDLLLSEFDSLKNNLTNGETPSFADCESQTIIEEVKEVEETILDKQEQDHEYEILDKNSTIPEIRVKIRGSSFADILTKFL